MELRAGIVRILKPNGATAGTGFVVADSLIATCAHVVEATGARPNQTVDIVFYATGDQQTAQIKSEWWRASNTEDVAILYLEKPLPHGVEPLILGSARGTNGHHFTSFGFPQVGPYDEFPASGTILGLVQHPEGWETLIFSSREISPGMSGAPILDEVTLRVVGMVDSFPQWTDKERRDKRKMAGDKFGRNEDTNFATPSDTLREICPQLKQSDICPYRGLDPFTKDDAPFFYGRDQLVDRLLTKLRLSPRFLALVGPSGSGKSSLVQAGLFPAFEQGKGLGTTAYRILTFRPGSDPLAASVNAGLGMSPTDNLKSRTQRFLGEQPEIERLVLFVDQFEELITRCTNKEVQKQFIDELLDLLDSNLPVLIILSVRKDFERDLRQLPFPKWSVWLTLGHVSVAPMSPAELKEAIEKPANKVGLRFQHGLVQTIVEDARQIEYQLPLLESALEQLWKRRQDGVLTVDAYQKIDGVAGALSQWAEDAYHSLEKDDYGLEKNKQQELARRIFTRLIYYGPENKNDTRRWQTLAQLTHQPQEEEDVQYVVQKLANARLLLTDQDPQTKSKRFEIVHDALLSVWARLQQWRDEEQRVFLLGRQRLQSAMDEWKHHDLGNGYLLRAEPLKEAKGWLTSRLEDLNFEEKSFIESSISFEKKRTRHIIFGGSTVTIVLLCFCLVAVSQFFMASIEREGREEQASIATSRKLARQGSELLENELDLALLVCLEAYNSAETVEAKDCLQTIISENNKLIQYLHSPTDMTSNIAFSPDGSLLASGACRIRDVNGLCDQGEVLLWDADSGQIIDRLWGAHDDFIWSSVFSPDGHFLASSSCKGFCKEGQIVIWDIATRKVFRSLKVPIGLALDLAFSPDSSTLVIGGCGGPDEITPACTFGAIALWDLETDQLSVEPLEDSYELVNSIALSPDGHTLAVIGSEHQILLWDMNASQLLDQTLKGHTDNVINVVFSPKSSVLASSSLDDTIILWDMDKGQPLHPALEANVNRNDLAFSPDGNILASGIASGNIILWDVASGQPLNQTLRAGSIESLVFSPTDNKLGSRSEDRTIVLWDIEVKNAFDVPEDQLGGALDVGVALSRESAIWALGSCVEGESPICKKGKVTIWDAKSGQQIRPPLEGYIGNDGSHSSLAFSPDGTVLASAICAKRIVPEFEGDEFFSDTLKIEINLCLQKEIFFWETKNWQKIHTIMYESSDFEVHLAFNPKREIFAFNNKGEINLWNTTTFQAIGEPLVSELDSVDSMAFSVDGNVLASGGCHFVAEEDGLGCESYEIVLWDITTGKPLKFSLKGHSTYIRSLAFSDDGKFLASSSFDRTIIVWDLTTGEPIGPPLKQSAGSLAFSPDGKILAAGLYDIILWDLESKQSIGPPLKGHTNFIIDLNFSSDGSILTSVGSDMTIREWDVNLTSWQSRVCRIANRNLTVEEWERFLGADVSYRRTCPDLPPGN